MALIRRAMHDMFHLLFALLLMPATISHALSMTTPNDPAYENQPQHWNSSHAVTLNAVGSELIGAFSNANGLSFGTEAGGGITGSYTVPSTIGFLTTAMASNRGSDFVQATAAFAGTSASGTIGSSGISVSIGPYITTADLSANSSKYVQNWKLTGNTSGTTSSAQGTDLWFQGGNSLTVSGSSNSVVFSVGNYITTAMASNRGTDFVQATAAFAGTSASGTINSTGISVSIGPYLTTAMASNRGTDFVQATAAFAGTNASGTINSTGISVSVAKEATLSYWEHPGGGLVGTTLVTGGGSSALVFPFVLEDYLSASYIRMPASWNMVSTSFATSAVPWSTTFSQVNTLWAVLYTQGVGASSRSIQYSTSASAGWTWKVSATGANATNNWTVSHLITWPQEGANTANTTLNVASTLSTVNVDVSAAVTNFTGWRYLDIPFAQSLSPGNYWIAVMRSSTTAGGKGIDMPMSHIAVSQSNQAIGNLNAATNSSLQFQLGLGSWSTNTNGTTTSSIGLANISSMVNQPRLSFAFIRQA